MLIKYLILLTLVAIIVIFLASTIVSPIVFVAEDSTEDASIDMAAKFSLGGFDWIYPGSSVNAEGQTLHNVHLNHPENPYGAAQEIISYSYGFTPHLFISINNDAADAIFGGGIVDDIRSHDGYYGYAGNGNVKGSMSRGDAVDTAMSEHGFNVAQIPIQMLMGNIRFFFV